MDTLVILLIVLAIIAVAVAVFALVRKKQRGGTVLAAPSATNTEQGGS